MEEQVYKFFLGEKVYFLRGNKIYDLSPAKAEEVQERYLDAPEIKAEEFVVGEEYLNEWVIIHDKSGTHIKHYKYEPSSAEIPTKQSAKRGRRGKKQILIDSVRELERKGLSRRTIAKRLETSKSTVQRVLV